MILLLYLIVGPFLFLITRSALGANQNNNSIWKKTLFKIYIAFIFFYLLVLYAEKYNYYIRGYRSTSIFFIIMAITGTFYWLIDRKEVFSNFFRAGLFCFSVVTIALSFLLAFEFFSDYKNQLFYDDPTYRLEDTRRGIGEPCILPVLFVKSNFYEQKYKPVYNSSSRCFSKSDISNIKIESLAQNQISVSYFFLTDKVNDLPNHLVVIYKNK